MAERQFGINKVWQHLDHAHHVELLISPVLLESDRCDLNAELIACVCGHGFVWFDTCTRPSLIRHSAQNETCGSANVKHGPWFEVFS